MAILRISLFGGFTLAWDETPLPLIPGEVNRSLLAYLVVHRDRPHTRDLLAGAFWPDLPDAVARRRLSQALWQIRKALAPHDILLAEGDTVQFRPDLSLWLDAEELENLGGWETGKLVDWELRDNAPDSQSTNLLISQLYRGEFLEGYYDDWLLIERERLREIFLVTLERLIAGLKVRGEYERALTCARRLASEDSWREQAHREVMRLCHLLDRDAEALKQFETCRRALADELGAEPSSKTVSLAREIAARSEAVAIPHLPVAARPFPLTLLERPDQIPLVGRRAERAALIHRLELAAAGCGGLVLLVGEAGVGKTRLMQEIARDAAWRGFGVAWSYSGEMSAPAPYQPLLEMLYDADLSRLPPVWRRELSRLLPDIGPSPPTLEPEQAKSRLLESLARAFLSLGQTAPHLLILEDLHWMDPASLEVLRILLPRLPTARLLMVGTLRPEEVTGRSAAHLMLAALERTGLPRRLTLAPLTATGTETLVRRLLEQAQPAPLFSQRLHARTAGNPFFITETLRTLVDGGLLYRDEAGAWTTPWDDATESYAELPLPASIVHSLEQRLARLTPATRDLLDAAAVIGRRVEFDLWLAATGCDEETAINAAEELAQRGLLLLPDRQAKTASPGGVQLRFAHETIRRVAYEGLSLPRCRRWHRRIAAALQALHPDDVESLARHHRLGQAWPQAVRYALRAGEQAQAVYANRQTLDHYRRAETWLAEGQLSGPAGGAWSEEEVARWRADLAERQGSVHSLVGQYDQAEAAFRRARQAWAALNDWRAEARVLNRQSFLHFVQGDYASASRYVQRSLATLPKTDPPPDLQAVSLTNQGLIAWSQGRYDDALPPLEKALAFFQQVGSQPTPGLARCLNSLGLVHLERGDLPAAERSLARSLALRRESGDRRGEGFCCYNLARLALSRDDGPAARRELEKAQCIFADIESAEGLRACDRLRPEIERVGRKTVTVRLPRAEAPLGRPLRDDEYVTVAWTVDASADEAIPGKAVRRQHRLLRLLQEADDQGAAPTMDHLAAALGVSQPTIRRDVAALRRTGHPVQTRGSRDNR